MLRSRFTLTSHLMALSLASAGLLTACDGGTDEPEDDGEIGTIVEAGKADNFFSKSAREYWVEGTANVTLDASFTSKTDDQRMAEVKKLIPFKQVAIGWFLNAYIVDKDTSHGDPAYGGFRALTKNGAYEDLKITKVSALEWTFSFRQQVGGQTDLISDIPDATANGDGTYTFALVVGKPSNADIQRLETDHEWYRESPWGEWDPSKVDASQKETLTLKIRQQPAEDDAWMEHQRLLSDGKLSIGVHFGWDYHSAYHEKHSKDVYTWLTGQGFKSPVAKYEDLRFNSGPLTKTIKYRGKNVAVSISLFWGQKGLETDPDTAAGGKQLEKDMLESLKSREVVIFSGHSGPFYGFALANWRLTSEGDVDDSELEKAKLMVGSYQLIVAEGCDTYGIGQSFALNADKPNLKDLDVITTTSFSNASTPATVKDVITSLIGESGTATTKKWSELLSDLDYNSSWFTTMYGVHGLDDDPHVHPWADMTKSCKSCTSNSACGDGMKCVKMADGKSACAAECTSSFGCGSGFECRNVAVNSYLENKVCAPTGLKCGVAPPAVAKVFVSEVMGRPDGDYNKDGSTSATNDEFVEIVNGGAAVANIGGWTVSDSYGVRHIFAANTQLPPGGALVVFAGGTPALVAGTTLVVKATTGALGLNDTGDTVTVSDNDGVIVSRVAYTNAVAKGQSWSRASELDVNAAFAASTPSAGTKNNGTNF